MADRFQRNCHTYAIKTAIEKGSYIIINWIKFHLIFLQTISRWQYIETVCVELNMLKSPLKCRWALRMHPAWILLRCGTCMSAKTALTAVTDSKPQHCWGRSGTQDYASKTHLVFLSCVRGFKTPTLPCAGFSVWWMLSRKLQFAADLVNGFKNAVLNNITLHNVTVLDGRLAI